MPGDLKDVIFDIESFKPQEVKRSFEARVFELKSNPTLLANLSGNSGALFVRAILSALSIDEHHVFRWRLENKFRQYQILNHYIPGCMPLTLSFSKLLNQSNGVQEIKELFLKGFFLKTTLGDGSYHSKSWDKTVEFDRISQLYIDRVDEYESYMLQQKLDLKSEFRVHTFCKDIIPCLTYLVQSTQISFGYTGVEKFVNTILQQLPDTILQGTLIAWDIGLTSNDEYYVIETNFTGYHPEYRAGFQTTGYVDDHYFGPIFCAWLNNYFNRKYGVYIDSVDSSLLVNYPIYNSFIFYISIFNNIHIDILKDKAKGSPLGAIIYLGEDTNMLIVRLIKHLLLVDYTALYYVIVKNECLLKVRSLFFRYDQVKIWSEDELFTIDQYQLIKQLSYDRRKQICCSHLIRKLNNNPYVVV